MTAERERVAVLSADELAWDEWLALYASRNEVAYEYASMLDLASSDWVGWPLVNGAILRRWSPSGLAYIQRRARKMTALYPQALPTPTRKVTA